MRPSSATGFAERVGPVARPVGHGTVPPKRALHIAISCSSRELFGADRSAVRLATVLRGLGHVPTLILPASRPERGLREFAQRLGIPAVERSLAIATSSGPELPLLRGLGELARPRCEAYDFEIVNSTAVVASTVRARYRITMVREWFTPHDHRHRALAQWHARRSNLLVGVSTGVRRQWQITCGRAVPVAVVPNWLDDTAVPSLRASSEGIVCLGRFNRWKGQDALVEAYLDAFGSLTARPPMTLVGAQEEGEFGVRARRLALAGVAGGWTVAPFVSDPSEYLAAANLLVVPSLQPEPFGTVILEALVRGCRVMAFEGGGPDDLAREFEGVVETVSRAPGQLAAKLVAWNDDGARGQTSDEQRTVATRLVTTYSRMAAESAWGRLLALWVADAC